MSRLMSDLSPGTYVLNPDTSARIASLSRPRRAAKRGPRRSVARRRQRVLRVRVGDHFDDLAVAERRHIGDRLIALVTGALRSHDHDDLVAGIDDINQLDVRATASERVSHELERLGAVLAAAGWVAAVPLDVRIEHLRDHLEVTAKHRVKTAAGYLGIALRHGSIIPPSHRCSGVGCEAPDIATQNIQPSAWRLLQPRHRGREELLVCRARLRVGILVESAD